MIYLRLKIDNLYMFDDTFIDFTYPKKTTGSSIQGEFLEDYPLINYKRFCVLMGANASGKTTLGRVLCLLNNFIQGRPISNTEKIIADKAKPACIDVIYVTPDSGVIHQLIICFNVENLTYEAYRSQPLRKSKNLSKTLSDLRESVPVFEFDININEKEDSVIKNPGLSSLSILTGHQLDDGEETVWNYVYSDYQSYSDNLKHYNLNVLEKIIKVFDNSIASVTVIDDIEKAYVIKFLNKDAVIVEDGKISDDKRLSRGTIESIEVANFISLIEQGREGSGTFFLDEKMAYSHTEIEIAMLNLIIEKLSRHSQFFYTTHNYDILEMNLPSHAFIFMKKLEYISISQPEKMGYAQNDRSLLGYVKNDVFGTVPDTSNIDDML